jgi:hypothetical protein
MVRERELSNESTTRPAVAGEPTGEQPVSLIVDFGDGEELRFPAVAWRDGMTAADLLVAVGSQAGDSPNLDVLMQGSGPSAFLTAIDGASNEGAGGRNWTYSLNGRRADRSFAVYLLAPGDQVLWNFAPSE